MRFNVVRVLAVVSVVEKMTKVERRAYDAAVDALKGGGCRAGGKRLMSTTRGDFPMCQRSLYRDWRMNTMYLDDGTIVIVSVAEHTADQSPNAELAEVFPDLSPSGRRRSDQPPCCEEPFDAPEMSDDLRALLFDLFGV